MGKCHSLSRLIRPISGATVSLAACVRYEMMLRAVLKLSRRKSLSFPVSHLAVVHSTRLRTTSTSRYSSVLQCPTQTRTRTPTTTEHRPLPLSDAQRKTIYALSTPPGKSGVAIIRISGPDALGVWRRMARPTSVRAARVGRSPQDKQSQPAQTSAPPPEPWKLERCRLVDPHTSEPLDDALAVFFRGTSPSSIVCPSG